MNVTQILLCLELNDKTSGRALVHSPLKTLVTICEAVLLNGVSVLVKELNNTASQICIMVRDW